MTTETTEPLKGAINRLRGYVDNGGLIHTASAYRTSDGRVHLIEFDDLRAVLDAAASDVPEPPTDDEREAVLATVKSAWHSNQRARGAWITDDAERGPHPGNEFDAITDAILASPMWRNRGRGPITDEVVEAAKWAIARERFERAGVDPGKVEQADADMCEADARAALEAARSAERGR